MGLLKTEPEVMQDTGMKQAHTEAAIME